MTKSVLTKGQIESEILQRAESFALHYDEEALKSNEIRMKAPMLYILLGDKVQDGVDQIRCAVERNLSNSEGVVYLCVDSNSTDKQNSESKFYIDLGDIENKERGELGAIFSQDIFLERVNHQLTCLLQSILEKNKMFSYWEQIHVTVVTRTSDKASVILPDLMVLIKNKLEQSFKQVFSDLFVLLEETGEDATALNQALSYSLFKELDYCQSLDYHYEKATERLDEDMKLMSQHDGPLFHLVYILSDKKESGQKINQSKKSHYESIVAVNLLKNRETKSVELEEAREQYNYNTFMSNIQVGAENRYASANVSRVRKPGQGIYLTVAYHVFKAYKKSLLGNARGSNQGLMNQLGLGDCGIEEIIRRCMPPLEGIQEIKSLISRPVSFKELRTETFQNAEQILYGNLAKEFFEINFKRVARKKLEGYLEKDKLREKLIQEVVCHPDYGPFAIEDFLKSDAYKTLEGEREKYIYQMKQYEEEILKRENTLVSECIVGNFGFLDKKYLQEMKNYLIDKIYKVRYSYEEVAFKLEVLDAIKIFLENFCKEFKEKLSKLDMVEAFFIEMIERANRYEEDYLVQNVKEYYEKVVCDALENLQEEKYMGSSDRVLSLSKEEIIEKICDVTEQEFLKEAEQFNMSFEEELLARANMLVAYENTEVLAKSELYGLLYESLEENSKPPVYLDTSLTSYRYIEKYFFGNRQSEFIDYAYKRDQSSRNYKIGTLNDKRKSVIEKLQIMGGFKLQDLIYTKSAERYYKAFSREKGYVFHSKDMQNILNDNGENK